MVLVTTIFRFIGYVSKFISCISVFISCTLIFISCTLVFVSCISVFVRYRRIIFYIIVKSDKMLKLFAAKAVASKIVCFLSKIVVNSDLELYLISIFEFRFRTIYE